MSNVKNPVRIIARAALNDEANGGGGMEVAENELKGKLQLNGLFHILVIDRGQTADAERGIRRELPEAKKNSNVGVLISKELGESGFGRSPSHARVGAK
jgi:hypothetical protein